MLIFNFIYKYYNEIDFSMTVIKTNNYPNYHINFKFIMTFQKIHYVTERASFVLIENG